MRAWGLVVVTLWLVGCPKAKDRSHEPSPVPTVDAAALLAREAEIVGARSTRCVLDRLHSIGQDLPGVVATFSPPVVTRLAYVALLSDPAIRDEDRAYGYMQAAQRLAIAGDLDGARWARGRAGAQEVFAGDAIGILLGEPPGDDLDLDHVLPLVLAGHAARAAEVFAAHDVAPSGDDDTQLRRGIDVGTALAALERHDELRARLDAAPPAAAAGYAIGWTRAAILTGVELDGAVAAVVAHRAGHPDHAGRADHDLYVLIEVAGPLGRAPAFAPLLRALRTAPGNADADEQRRSLLWLYRLAFLVGDDAEIAALDARVAGQAQAGLIRARARGTFDELLAAIAAFDGEYGFATRSYFLGEAWARHVATGFTPDIEAKLAGAACTLPVGCLADRLTGPSVRITADGVTAGQARVAGPDAANDRAAIAAALKPGIAEACGVFGIDTPSLAIALEPTGSARLAIATARAAFDAGFAEVRFTTADGLGACALEPAPPRDSYDEMGDAQVDLSVLVSADRTWFGLSRINELTPFEPGQDAAMRDEIVRISDSTFFEDRRDAEIAAEDGASAEALEHALVAVCPRFPQLRLLEPAELAARPTL